MCEAPAGIVNCSETSQAFGTAAFCIRIVRLAASKIMNPRKLLVVGTLVIAAGYVGFLLGKQQLAFEYKNWKPALIVNRSPRLDQAAAEVDFSLFWTVWDKVSGVYVDKRDLDAKKMVDGAISGMVAAIGDPYTAYLPMQKNKESKEDLGGEFEGVGIQLGFKAQNLAVVAPLDGTPAQRAGIRAGDLIVLIKDDKRGVNRSTEGMALAEAVQLIRGPGQSKVKLTIVREGVDEPFEVELVRETILVKSVLVEYKEKAAWVKLSRFGDKTREEWGEAVNQLASLPESELKGVILDLRNNPGGYLEMATYIAGEFLPAGKNVVTQQYGDGSKLESAVDRNGRLLKVKLVVLVNQGSASAAEILAGALQDYKRAKVVGETSFGKGSVQQPEDFPDGSGVHITVAKWLRPSGEWIDKVGVTPDVVVEMPEGKDDTSDPQLEKAMEMLR